MGRDCCWTPVIVTNWHDSWRVGFNLASWLLFLIWNSSPSLYPSKPTRWFLESSAEWLLVTIDLLSRGYTLWTSCRHSVHSPNACHTGLCGVLTYTWNKGDFGSDLPHDPHVHSCNTVSFCERNFFFFLWCQRLHRLAPSGHLDSIGKKGLWVHGWHPSFPLYTSAIPFFISPLCQSTSHPPCSFWATFAGFQLIPSCSIPSSDRQL